MTGASHHAYIRSLCVLIVLSGAEPALLVAHIPQLCYSARIPVLPIANATTILGTALNLTKALALGFRSDLPALPNDARALVSSVVPQLISLAPALSFPWVAQDPVAAGAVINAEAGPQPKRRKREPQAYIPAHIKRVTTTRKPAK